VPSLRIPGFNAVVPPPGRRAAWLLMAALLALACWAGGRVGLAAPRIDTHVSLLWPPTGIALAALLRYGPGLWPGVWLAALALALGNGLPFWAAAPLALGNALSPALAAWALRRRGFHVGLDRRRDLRALVTAIAGAMLLNAGNGCFWLALADAVPWTGLPQVLLARWFGDVIGALIVGVPLLTLSHAALQQAVGGWRWLSGALLAGLTVAGGLFAFVLPASLPGVWSPLLFLPYLLLGWLTVRSGIFAASCAVLLLALGALSATSAGHGPFVLAEPGGGSAMLAGYLATLSAMPLLVTALLGELAATERRWQLALDASSLGVADWNLARGRIEFSPRWLAQLGQPAGPAAGPAALFWEHVHEHDVDPVEQALQALRSAAGTHARIECRLQHADGSWPWFELNALVAERGAGGEPQRLVCTVRDITERRLANERQQVAESLFRQLHEGLLVTDAQHRVREVNPTFCEITGFNRDELLGRIPALLLGPTGHDEGGAATELLQGLASDGMWRGERVLQRPDGRFCTLQLSVSAVRGPDGAVRSHVVAVSDLTQARQQQERLQRQARYDELTQLPNRAHLAQMLQAALVTSERDGSLLTVCHLDLDHFKTINVRHGHAAGDRLLVELANRLRGALRSWAGGDDIVARLGGDEFVLLLRTATLQESRHAVERLLRQVTQPNDLGPAVGPVSVTASVGATVFPIDRADAETLLRHADQAMYGAKQAGRNGYLYFDAEHDRRTTARFLALGRVQEALDAGEFVLHYQPKVELRSGRTLGAEALLRWNHPEQGLVPPGQFLPLVEHTGLATTLGRWVLAQGIGQLSAWLREGLDISLSLNVSARHLQEPSFADELEALLALHGAEVARHVVIEVLETAALADVAYTSALMQRCRALGVRFALDDFGTGYSTFTYLKQLPLDLLKIDRSFVAHMLEDRQDEAIVEGVIALGHTFGCATVAEGIETEAQARRLLELGCELGQGNGIAAAMPALLLPGWVRSRIGTAAAVV